MLFIIKEKKNLYVNLSKAIYCFLATKITIKYDHAQGGIMWWYQNLSVNNVWKKKNEWHSWYSVSSDGGRHLPKVYIDHY